MHKLFTALFILFAFHFQAQEMISAKIAEEQSKIETSLLPRMIIKGEPKPYSTLESKMKDLNVPGVSVAVARNGKLHWAKAYGIANTDTGSKVTTETLFQAGSISKPLAALAALTLVQEGKIDLDQDVNTYLTSWKIPDSEFTETEKVTLRRLLTHTAGTTVHGFPGYSDKDDFPSDIDVLSGKGNTGKVEVDKTPGESWRYSGGGYTVMERMVEDVSGMDFASYMDAIFAKLGMSNSTYAQPLPKAKFNQASLAYNRKGKIIDGSFHHYPEQAAAGLWTTPSDLMKYIFEIQAIANGKEDGILSPKMVEEMLTKHMGNWGLGPSLSDDGEALRFGHGGKNAGFTNNMTAGVYSGNAVVIMTNADNGGQITGGLQSSIARFYDMGFSKVQEIEIYDMSEKQLSRFEGTYVFQNFKAKLKVKNGILVAKVGGAHELTPVGPLTFKDMKDPETITFNEDEDGKIISLSLEGPGIEMKKEE